MQQRPLTPGTQGGLLGPQSTEWQRQCHFVTGCPSPEESPLSEKGRRGGVGGQVVAVRV